MATAGVTLETPDLSGNTWPVSVPVVGTGQRLFVFIGGWTRGAASNPSLTGGVTGTVRFDDDYPEYYLRGALFDIPGARSAGTITFNWSGSGCTGSAYAIVVNAGEFDIGSGVLRDPTMNNQNRTLPALTASSDNSVRAEFIITAMNREMSNAGLSVESEATYHSGPTGGVGVCAGTKAVSSGSTTGSQWTFIDPDNRSVAAAGASPSVGWVVIFKPDNSPTSPIISGTVNAPDEAATVAPIAPTQAPTVTVLSTTTANVTVTGIDPTATTVFIGVRRIVNGVPATDDPAQFWSGPVSGATWPVKLEFLLPGASYRVSAWVEKNGIRSALSPESAVITMMRSVIHFFTDPSAVGVTGVKAQVFAAPTDSNMICGNPLFVTSGLSFDQSLYNGRARLVINMLPGVSYAESTVVVIAMKDHGDGRQTWTRPASGAVVNM